MERRLAAILAADVVGYSALMGADEAGTLECLKAHRRELIDPTIASHKGRVVKLMGDGLLVEFASVVEAVQCAVKIQEGMARRNGKAGDRACMELRIGVNLGDVIVEGEDLYGDGINVAARLEGLAEPGGICVRRDVRDQVRDKLPLAFEDLGEIEVKNIARPVRAFKILLDGAAPQRRAPLEPVSKPSIAVLPFANQGDDGEQAYFAEGITEDIITELGRFRSLFVIARDSAFTYQDKDVALQEIGRELGARYLVRGSVRRAGARVRVSAQLVEAESGSQLWAERYDRELADIFAVQDEVVQAIVATVAGRLDEADRQRALRKPAKDLTAYDLLLRARHIMESRAKEDLETARTLLEQALENDPDFAPAFVELAMTAIYEAVSAWTDAPEQAAERAFELARKAVELDDRDSRAHLVLAWAHFWVQSNFELAESQLEDAMVLNPNDYGAYCFKSWFLTCAGDLDGSISCANEAIRRSPLLPSGCLYSIGMADYLAGRYERAIVSFGKMSKPYIEVHAFLAACYAQLGRVDEAEAAAQAFRSHAAAALNLNPCVDAESWRAYWRRVMPFKDSAPLDHLLEGLAKAGLP
ncbi:MAG: adenylate/guanylate cyclase domain-containing protein [Pseudomonadota bacterium]